MTDSVYSSSNQRYITWRVCFYYYFLLYNSFTLPDKNCKNNWAKLRVNTQNTEVTYLENKALNTERHIFPLKAAENNPHLFLRMDPKPRRGRWTSLETLENRMYSTEEVNTLDRRMLQDGHQGLGHQLGGGGRESSWQNGEGVCQHLQLVLHSLQASLDLQRVVQNLHAAGVRVEPHREGTLDAGHVRPLTKTQRGQKTQMGFLFELLMNVCISGALSLNPKPKYFSWPEENFPFID